MLRKAFCLITLLATSIHGAYAEGVQVGATRVVYNADKNQASVPVSNPSDRAYLIQSWVSKDVKDNAADQPIFITTPPLFKLEPKTSNDVRIVYNGTPLPQDRESLFWLNIKAIPATAKNDAEKNTLTLAVKTQIKLFYRPKGLEGHPSEAYQRIEFKSQDGKLVVINPTPYNISFADLKVNGLSINEPLTVMPFSTLSTNKNITQGSTLSWQVINDFGGVTPLKNNKVTQ